MKNISSSLLDYYASGQTELAYGILIERFGPGNYFSQLIPDAERPQYQLFGFTSHDKPATINLSYWQYYGPGFTTFYFTFDSVQGFDLSAIVSNGNLSVDNLEITTLDDGTFFNREDIIAGKWANTFFRIFRYRTDVAVPDSFTDCETLFKGWFGEFKLTDTTITVELRNMTEAIQQPLGEVSTKTCRNEFADSGCGLNLFHVFTVTDVISQKEIYCADANVPTYTTNPNFFTNGLVRFKTGNNQNLSNRVAAFSDTGYPSGYTFKFLTPMILPIQIGDQIEVWEGCDKTLNTCINRFDNVRRFRGEPHRPTTDQLSR